jgi:hypothetical protein
VHLQTLREVYHEVSRHRAAVALRSHSNGGDPKGSAWAEHSLRLETELEWFNDRDISIKDVEQGLIDFPAVIDGRDVLLCWKDPEPEVAFWHTPEAGFAGRQPL